MHVPHYLLVERCFYNYYFHVLMKKLANWRVIERIIIAYVIAYGKLLSPCKIRHFDH
jgi:hypothetical protein